MADTPTIGSGSNLTETMKKIQSAIDRIRQFKTQRQEINADILAVREGLTAIGIPKAAFDMALRYLDWEPEKRQGFDLAYALVREAGGLPLQGDLFAQAEQTEREVEAKKKAAEPTKKEAAKAIAEAVFRQEKGEIKKAPPAYNVVDDEPPSVEGSVTEFAKRVEEAAG